MREELIERAETWAQDDYDQSETCKSIPQLMAEFALEVRDEAVRERDAEWLEAIDWVRLSDDGITIFTATEDSFGEGWNAALDSLKAKMVD